VWSSSSVNSACRSELESNGVGRDGRRVDLGSEYGPYWVVGLVLIFCIVTSAGPWA
jgi:hypothetical protein